MLESRFAPPAGAFTRSVPIRFSHCDPAGIVYFPHYFDMFNGLIEDWYTQELGYDYAALIMGDRRDPVRPHRMRFSHSEPDRRRHRFDTAGRAHRPLVARRRRGLPSRRHRAAARPHGHRNDVLQTRKSMPLPAALRAAIEAYQRRTTGAA